jgi:RecB family endonuclease NucS
MAKTGMVVCRQRTPNHQHKRHAEKTGTNHRHGNQQDTERVESDVADRVMSNPSVIEEGLRA